MESKGLFNVVIVATNFNPSIFTQLWLVNNGIFSDKDVESNYVYTPMAVNLRTQEVEFIALPDRVQLAFLDEQANFQGLIDRTITKIVTKLPHTPYQAVGFNMIWTLFPKNVQEFQKISRQFFLSATNPIGKFFQSEDSRFGCYLSKDVDIGRLRVEIKPVTLSSKEGKREGFQMAFNFNRDLKEENRTKHLLEFLAGWDSAHAMGTEIADALGNEWAN